MSGLTLDAGALRAFEKGDRKVVAIVARALEQNLRLAVPTGVIAHVWRDGRRQARLARLLASRAIEIVPLDDGAARAAGQRCGLAKTRDIVDATVVLCAEARGQGVLTSDPDDLLRLAPRLRIVRV